MFVVVWLERIVFRWVFIVVIVVGFVVWLCLVLCSRVCSMFIEDSMVLMVWFFRVCLLVCSLLSSVFSMWVRLVIVLKLKVLVLFLIEWVVWNIELMIFVFCCFDFRVSRLVFIVLRFLWFFLKKVVWKCCRFMFMVVVIWK